MTDADLFAELAATPDVDARVAEADEDLKRRRAAVKSAEALLSKVRDEQAGLSARIARLHEQLGDKTALANLGSNPDQFPSAARKRSELENQRATLAQAADAHMLLKVLPANLAVKRAQLDLLMAERAYIFSATLSQLREYEARIRALLELDPGVTVAWGEGSFITQSLLALDARDREIADARTKLAEEEVYLSRQQAGIRQEAA